MVSTKVKKRVIREDVKDKHTSHWDQDMLSWSELESLMQPTSIQSDPGNTADLAETDQSANSRQPSE